MTEKPECFGEEELYDPDDRLCRDCGFEAACSYKVKQESNTTNSERLLGKTSYQNRSSRTSSYLNKLRSQRESKEVSVRKQEHKVVQVEAEEEDTFTSVLMHNASLEAVQAMVDELSNSIKEIPRKSYKNLWKRKKT